MPEVTKRAILMLKTAHPEYGCERISDLPARGPALPAFWIFRFQDFVQAPPRTRAFVSSPGTTIGFRRFARRYAWPFAVVSTLDRRRSRLLFFKNVRRGRRIHIGRISV
jgi:hypothetical protein